MKKVHSAVNIRIEEKFTNDSEANNYFYRPTSAIYHSNLFKNKLKKSKRLSTQIFTSKSTINSTSSSFLLMMSSSSKLLLYDESLKLKQQRNSLINTIALLKSNIRKKENQIRSKEKQIENNNKLQTINPIDYRNYEKMIDNCSLSKVKTTFNNLKSAYNTLIDNNLHYKSIIRQSKQSEAFIHNGNIQKEIKHLVANYIMLQTENNVLSKEYTDYIEICQSISIKHDMINLLQNDLDTSTNRVKQYHREIKLINDKARQVNNQIKKLKIEKEKKEKQLVMLRQEKQSEEDYLKNKPMYEAKIRECEMKVKEYRERFENMDKVVKEMQNVIERQSKKINKSIHHTTINMKKMKYEVFEPNPDLNHHSKLLLTQSFINESKQKQCKYKLQLKTFIKELTDCGLQVQSIEDINNELNHLSMKGPNTITFNSHQNTTQVLNSNQSMNLLQQNKSRDNSSNEDEFTTIMYVILKNIEAKRLNPLDFQKIFSSDNYIGALSEEQLNELNNKIVALLELSTEVDKSKVKEWLALLLKLSNNDIGQVAETVKYLLVNNIRNYTDDEDLIFSKKLKGILLPYKDKIKTTFNYNENKNNHNEQLPCIISFVSLRTFFEEEKIEMKEILGEYLFYKLKQVNNSIKLSLYELDLSILFQIFDNNVNDSKMNENTETDIEISQEDYTKIIIGFIIQLNDYLSKNQMTVKELFQKVIKTVEMGFEVIDIEDFLQEIKKIDIVISNELDIYCLFNRYKVSDELEVLSLDLISNDLNGLKDLDKQELLQKRPMENVPEEDESLEKQQNGSH